MAKDNFGVHQAKLGLTGWCLLVGALALFTALFFHRFNWFYQMECGQKPSC